MVISIILGVVLMVVYCSFAEWFVHRYGMHTQKLSKWAFRRHAIQHHAQRRSLKTFYSPDIYKIWQSSAIPLLWLLHAPLYFLIGALTNQGVGIGAALGAGLYVSGYEVLHFFIHTPRNYWFQRTRLFHFYCEYHRVHHHRAKWNYNVVCPLADAIMGTFSLADMPVEPSLPNTMPRHTGPRSVFGQPVGKAVGAEATASLEPEPVPAGRE